MNYLLQIIEIKNLYWAWEKAKSFYQPGDIWFDELLVSQFEANLHNELLSIQSDIENGKYVLKPIRPVAFPKSSDKEEGARTRQTFWISVRDQVAWLAIVNILGREIDIDMPFWSYGNRLYISTFYENDPISGKNELNFGYYRNSTRHTYRKWTQSWPLYRRHITLTAKLMALGGNCKSLNEEDLIDREPEMLEVNDKLDNDHPLKVKYIEAGYWSEKLNGELFWAGLDLKNFYPKLNLNIVKQNIKSFFPNEASLNNLLDSLLAFKIDFSGWESDECKKIKLDKRVDFEQMPTGLFVAGFLANVAMLAIDKEINHKLEKKRNIAHFRYVDDHLILATSFDDLICWIKEYQEIIESSNIGPEFNKDKTQPKELADYLKVLENKGADDYRISTIGDEAINATKLDPAFPSPLMTQTLAKVSKIAGTEFQLLDHDEERNLIADIEHLLVTEFPDQELRRDTRVSFAARMLSNFVPLMTVNPQKTYNLESSLVSLNEEKATLERKKVDTEDIQKRIKRIATKLKGEYEQIDKEENLLVKRTLKLLLKAIRDNHDKVRLWARVLDFSFKTGKVEISEILREIDSLRDKEEVNDLSAGFIHSLLLQLLSQLLFRALNTFNSNRVSNKQKTRSLSFIKMVIKEDVLNYFDKNNHYTNKFYEKDSLLLFKYSCGTVIFLMRDNLRIDSNLIDKYHLINWNKNHHTFIRHTFYDEATWAWWTFNKVSLNVNRDLTLLLWKKIANKLNFGSPLGRNIVQLFSGNLSKTILGRIEDNKSHFIDNEGWLFEVRLRLIENNIDFSSYSFLKTVDSKCNTQLKNNITLYDWINWTKTRNVELKEKYKNKLVFDPRLSEWMALEIIKQIAVIINDKINKVPLEIILSDQEKDYSISLHPNNFKVPRKWQEGENLTWEKLRGIIDPNSITMRAKEDLIYDKRFDFTDGLRESLYFDNHVNNKAINAIGSLLICLLAKKFELPYRWNPLGHQQVWLGLAKTELRDIALSSYTRDLIDSCFSNRNVETILLRQLNARKGMSLVNDTAADPPLILDLDDFIKYVEHIQSWLSKQQLSVSSNQPRQLIPISLKQKSGNFYQEQIENDNEVH